MRYDFHCPSCKLTFEIVRKMAEAGDPTDCPDCGAQAQRVFGVPPVQYKASGFYATDYFKDNTFAGSKQDWIRKNYEKQTGEKAPDPIKE